MIVDVDGQPIAAATDLGRVLDSLRPGQDVEVRVIGTDGAERTEQVKLGTKPLPNGFLEP